MILIIIIYNINKTIDNIIFLFYALFNYLLSILTPLLLNPILKPYINGNPPK